MAYTDVYAYFDLATGNDDGTTEANAYKTQGSMLAGIAIGERVNIKKTASRYSLTGSWNITFDASATQRLWIRGYETTIGDGVDFEIDTTSSYNITSNGDQTLISCLDIIGTRTDHIIKLTSSGDGSVIRNCRVVNNNTTAANSYAISVQDGACFKCYAETKGTGTGTAAIIASRSSVDCCKVKSTRAGIEMDIAFGNVQCSNNTVIGSGASTTHGIDVIGYSNSVATTGIINNTVYNFEYGVYFDSMMAPSALGMTRVYNNVFYDISAYAIYNAGSATNVWSAFFSNNGFGAVTSGNYSGFTDNESVDDYSIADDPFTDSANDDFSLVSGSEPIAAGVDAGSVV